MNLQKVFDENKKIHDHMLLEIENKRIANWLNKLDKCQDIKEILTILYMVAGNESNRTIKILIQRAKEINDKINQTNKGE